MTVVHDMLRRDEGSIPVSAPRRPAALWLAVAALLLVVAAQPLFAQGAFVRDPVSVAQLFESSVAWGDYNNDGLLDFALIGSRDTTGAAVMDSSKSFAGVYQNNGNGTFTVHTAGLMPVAIGVVAWGDYDNDGYLDLLYGGVDTLGAQVTKLYHNNAGNGTFTENTGTAFHSSSYGSVAWADFDNDGWLDILMSAYGFTGPVTMLYKNNKNGTFSEVGTAGLPGANGHSRVAWGDYDNDGYPDLVVSGRTNQSWVDPQSITRLYHNSRGTGTFTLDTSAHFVGVSRGAVAFADFNNDGYLDVLVVGMVGGTTPPIQDTAVVYLNNAGNGTFTASAPVDLLGASQASASVGDYDGDGNVDILPLGYGSNAKILRGGGAGNFTQVSLPMPELAAGGTALGDYNGDGYMDAIVTGTQIGVSRDSTLVLRNIGTGTVATYAANTKPNAPTNLKTTVLDTASVRLSWSPATDDKTPSKGLSYAIRVGTASGGSNIVNAWSDSTRARPSGRGGPGAGCTPPEFYTVHNPHPTFS